MARQFYSERVDSSLNVLHDLSREVDFVLIGGWAVYSYVNTQKSMDIDIAIDYVHLDYFKKYGIDKYPNININYTKINGVVVDIFLPEFSDKDLPLKTKDILSNYTRIHNMKVVNKEMLLLLKVWGYFSNDYTKLQKDIIDFVSLLFYGDIEFPKLKKLIKSNNLERRRTTDVMLEYLDKGKSLSDFITKDLQEYRLLHAKCKERIKSTFDY